MLVLTRKLGEAVVLRTENGDKVVVTVVNTERGKVRLGFTAAREVSVDRQEVDAGKHPEDYGVVTP